MTSYTSEGSKNLIPFPHYSTHVGTKNGDSKNLIIQSSILRSGYQKIWQGSGTYLYIQYM